RVVAQVENIAAQIRTELLLQIGNRLLHAGIGLFTEGRDADIADIALLLIFDALDADDRARQRQFERLLLAGSQDGQRDLGILWPAHPLDRVIQRHALDAGAIDR